MAKDSNSTPKIFADEEVYSPNEDSFLLEDSLAIKEGSYVLDMGTGTGILAIKAALLGARRVLAVDINPFASRCALKNTRSNGLRDRIDVLTSDLFCSVRGGVLFDMIVFNPPYLRTKLSEYKQGWLEKAWAGGSRGRAVIDRFIDRLPKHLKTGGHALLLHPSYGVKTTIRKLRELGMEVRVVARKCLFSEHLVVISAMFSGTPNLRYANHYG